MTAVRTARTLLCSTEPHPEPQACALPPALRGTWVLEEGHRARLAQEGEPLHRPCKHTHEGAGGQVRCWGVQGRPGPPPHPTRPPAWPLLCLLAVHRSRSVWRMVPQAQHCRPASPDRQQHLLVKCGTAAASGPEGESSQGCDSRWRLQKDGVHCKVTVAIGPTSPRNPFRCSLHSCDNQAG